MRSRRVHVYFLPSLVEPPHLAGTTSVVIDVLRATTTIVHALAAGATQVIPCLEVETAKRMAQTISQSVLGGERQGMRISGFDLGNSPAEYTRESVGGKTVIMTTTNGTRALLHCHQAKQVLVAAFTNFSAICDMLGSSDDVAIVCAGTNQEITREDVLLAGAITSELFRDRQEWEINDQAMLATDAWHKMQAEISSPAALMRPLRESFGGRNLIDIGQERDIEIAATIDKFHLVPIFNVAQGCVRLR